MYAVITSRRGSAAVVVHLRQILIDGKPVPPDRFTFDPYSAVLCQFIGSEESYSAASDTIESVRIFNEDEPKAITEYSLLDD